MRMPDVVRTCRYFGTARPPGPPRLRARHERPRCIAGQPVQAERPIGLAVDLHHPRKRPIRARTEAGDDRLIIAREALDASLHAPRSWHDHARVTRRRLDAHGRQAAAFITRHA